MLADLLVEGISFALLNLLGADLDGAVEDLTWEVQLHQVLEDAQNNDLGSGEATDQQLRKHIKLIRVS